MAGPLAMDAALHTVSPTGIDSPRRAPVPGPVTDPQPEPLDEVARGIVADAQDTPAAHNRAWHIPGGGE